VLNQVVASEMVRYLRYAQNAIVAQGIHRAPSPPRPRTTDPQGMIRENLVAERIVIES
jgi:hypothetical protein